MRAADGFWNWFIEHEGELFDLDPNREEERERISDKLATQLQKVDPDLAFELGPKEAKREFVISAAGLRRAFPAVIALRDAAPPLNRWQVTAFRPRRVSSIVLEFRGKQVDQSKVRFSLLDNGKTAGIYLFIPGFQEGDANWKQIGYLLLDETLGEYDVESRLGLIKMFPPDTQTMGERYPLAELPKLFDEVVSRLEGHSGKPS
jgi:hypothetical protein